MLVIALGIEPSDCVGVWDEISSEENWLHKDEGIGIEAVRRKMDINELLNPEDVSIVSSLHLSPLFSTSNLAIDTLVIFSGSIREFSKPQIKFKHLAGTYFRKEIMLI